ncbi:MAG: class II aldolase/adducin family protein [Archaeoglobaceae archaeon]|nr:class II aldolase/adducin family protein [Archaeoglobaceae archaeon]MDW8117673.1 class II aldolase/adducin family protein [Archaeoglobaceae archaeon]
MIQNAIEVGKMLFQSRLVDGASGNISFREREKILITKSGTNLDSLSEESFVDISHPQASRDRLVHAKIYENTNYNAVIHCHGVFNVVLSLKNKKILPLDLEGKLYLGELKVVNAEFGSKEYAEEIAEMIKANGVVIAKAHGIYSAGKDLIDAFNKACYAEHSCEVLYYLSLLDKL